MLAALLQSVSKEEPEEEMKKKKDLPNRSGILDSLNSDVVRNCAQDYQHKSVSLCLNGDLFFIPHSNGDILFLL